jgi:ribosomal protein S18 acetylase RimI-like enzyme
VADAVRDITAADVEPVVASLARAFTDDPLMRFLVPDDRHRTRRAGALFSSVLRYQHLGHGACFTDEGRHGASMWAPPGQWRMTLGQIARSTPGSIRALGTRMVAAVRVLTTVERLHPREEHWYLAVLGTDPDHQGKGIGSALMTPVLDRCDEQGVGAYLESSNPTNVPFYRRHGFEVTREIELPGGPTVYPMWRDPH